jgi:hypothetical protein
VTFRLLLSNDGPSDNDYLSSIVHRAVEPKLSPWSNYKSAVNHVDFDQNFDPINPSTDSGGGRYTAQDGDTLQTVAAAVWGDAAMWYLLAEANGMTGDTQLAAGMSLIIPAKVANVHNNADTFRPYDPNKAIGDVSPTEMKPPERPKAPCGMMGQILLIVIAVAVTAWLGPQMILGLQAALGTIGGAVAAGAIAGAAGSIASQTVGVVTGLQKGFSWKGVAMSALAGGIGGGVGASGIFDGIKSTFIQGAAQGAASNAITQGIGVATGLQDKFSWVGVATAGVVGGVAAWTSARIGGAAVKPQMVNGQQVGGSAATLTNRLVSGAIANFAGAATRSALTGTSFGDNMLAVLPDVIGSTIGNIVADTMMVKAEAEPAGTGASGASANAGSGDSDAAPMTVSADADLSGRLPSMASYFGGEPAAAAAAYGTGATTDDPNEIVITGYPDERPAFQPAVYSYFGDDPNDQTASGSNFQLANSERYGPRLQLGWARPKRGPEEVMPGFPKPPAQPKGDGTGGFATEDPAASDYIYARAMKESADVAGIFGYDDASKNLRHYLGATGATIAPDVLGMLNEISGFVEDVNARFLLDVVAPARSQIRSDFDGDVLSISLPGKWAVFDGTEGNWRLALGGFSFAHTALVTATPAADGLINVRIESQLHVFDRYNWDPGKTADPFGIRIPDTSLGRLNQVGLAREYDIRGTLQRPTITFTMDRSAWQAPPPPPPVPKTPRTR